MGDPAPGAVFAKSLTSRLICGSLAYLAAPRLAVVADVRPPQRDPRRPRGASRSGKVAEFRLEPAFQEPARRPSVFAHRPHHLRWFRVIRERFWRPPLLPTALQAPRPDARGKIREVLTAQLRLAPGILLNPRCGILPQTLRRPVYGGLAHLAPRAFGVWAFLSAPAKLPPSRRGSAICRN